MGFTSRTARLSSMSEVVLVTKTDSFDVLMAGQGGRLTEMHVSHSSAWLELAMIKTFLNLWLGTLQKAYKTRQQWQNSPIGIEFDLLASLEINAIAASNTSVDGVGINAGLVAYVENAFYALMAYEPAFPAIGEPLPCATSTEVVSSITNLDLAKGWGTCKPQEGERKQTAFMLSRIAELFILFHEVSHVSYGHLLHPDLQSQPGFATLLEFGQSNNSGSRRLMQAMEFDADEGAAARSLDVLFAQCEHWDSVSTIYGERAPSSFSAKFAVYLWVVAISILFRVLDLFTRNTDLAASSSHPPPGARTDHAIYCGRNWTRTEYPQYADLFKNSANQALVDVKDAWRELRLQAVTHAIDEEERYKYVAALRHEMLRHDKETLNDLLIQRGNSVLRRYGTE